MPRYRIKAYPESSRLVALTFNAATATSTTAQQSTTLTVGGGVGQLPPGRWRFAVVAENANSQVRCWAWSSGVWMGWLEWDWAEWAKTLATATDPL